MNNRVMITGLCSLLAACASDKPLGVDPKTGASSIQVPHSGQLPPPDRSDLVAQNRPYLIGPFDKLTIDVFGIQDLSNKEVQADAGGRISFPLVGIIDVLGRTPAEVKATIKDKLRARFVRDPQVTVNLKEAISQTMAIDGEVREPGLYPVVGHMTLMRAVATAKGVGEFAKLQDVVVFRTVKGQRMAALYNLEAIRRGYYDDPEIFADDVVVVGTSEARRVFKDVLQVAPILTTPLILALEGRR